MDSEIGLRQAQSIISADMDSTSKSASVNHMTASTSKSTSVSCSQSEYSHIWDANIAQNKKLLGELGLLSVLAIETDKTTKKKGKKGKKEKKEVRAVGSLTIAR